MLASSKRSLFYKLILSLFMSLVITTSISSSAIREGFIEIFFTSQGTSAGPGTLSGVAGYWHGFGNAHSIDILVIRHTNDGSDYILAFQSVCPPPGRDTLLKSGTFNKSFGGLGSGVPVYCRAEAFIERPTDILVRIYRTDWPYELFVTD